MINHTKCTNYSCVSDWLLQCGAQDYCGIQTELPESWCDCGGGIDHGIQLDSVHVTQYDMFGSLHQYVNDPLSFERTEATISLNFPKFHLTNTCGPLCVLIQSPCGH